VKRRDSLFALLSASISGSPLLVDAQGLRPTRPFRIGLVPDFSPVWWESMLQIFTQGLAEQGHIEGRDYVLIRSGVFYGPNEQRAIARVLEGKPDLILATNLGYVVALRKATTTIPIVMWVSGFPVEGGVAESLTRPGGNVTGLTAYASGEVFNKLVHLLYEVKPSMKRLGVLMTYVPPFHPRAESDIVIRGMRSAAQSLGVDLGFFDVAKAEEVDNALIAIVRERMEALVLTTAPTITPRRHEIMLFAVERRLPTITDAGWESAGDPQPMMDYEPDFGALMRQAVPYVHKILWQGAIPGELPIQLPTRFNFRINLRTARAIGLTVPRSVLLRADQVVE